VTPNQCPAKRSTCQKVMFDYMYEIVDFQNDPKEQVPLSKIPAYESSLQTLLLEYGPVGVFVCSKKSFFKNWSPRKRPFIVQQLGKSRCTCVVNHNMVVVGWTPQYWILQNSWGFFSSRTGAARGDNGMWRLERGQNTCGLFSASAFVMRRRHYRVELPEDEDEDENEDEDEDDMQVTGS